MAATKPLPSLLVCDSVGRFSGHKASISCLAVNPNDSLLASGSEDNTVRIWDLANKKCCKVAIPEKILFEAVSSDDADAGNEILALCFVGDFLLLVGIGSAVVCYDLNVDAVVIHNHIGCIDLGAGAINSMSAFQGDATKPVYSVVCACDEGIVTISVSLSSDNSIQLERTSSTSTLHSAFVTTVKPLPSSNSRPSSRLLVSGGFDCKVKLSEENGRLEHEFDLAEQPAHQTGNTKQMFNPPFVHCLDVHPSGSWIAVASGNGSVELLNADYKARSAPVEAHASSVNFVTFASVPSASLSSENHTILLTTGNDRTLCFRSFESPKNPADILKEADIRSRQTELLSKIVSSGKPASKPQAKLLSSFTTQLAQLQGTPKINLLRQTKMPEKINWMVTTTKVTTSGNLFVADTSDSLQCYRVLMP